MTQEDKELLLKDLCARLPYGVKCQIYYNNEEEDVDLCINRTNIDRIVSICIETEEIGLYGASGYFYPDNIKPYLFPLSSMTEKQKKEYNYWKHEVPVCRYEYGDVVEEVELFDSPESFEYLIENHFDYRGLIEKGLAIDATGLNIY